MDLHIEMATPSVLPLAFAKMVVDGAEKPVMLGMTLQHPPTQIFVQQSTETKAYGPRAHVLSENATAWLTKNEGANSAEFRIESTVPSLVGFNSDAVLKLSTAKALAWANQHDHDDYARLAADVALSSDDALAYHGVASGGIILVEMTSDVDGHMPALLRRHEVKHKENKAWAVVYHYPRIPKGMSEDYEAERGQLVKQAAGLISAESGSIITDKIWPALENDDIVSFTGGLNELKALNDAALSQIDGWSEGLISAEALQKAIAVMNDNGSLFSSETLAGLSAFSLVHGARLSQQIRKELVHKLGYFAGQFAASITDNRGIIIKEFSENLHFHDYPVPNLIEGISGEGRADQAQ